MKPARLPIAAWNAAPIAASIAARIAAAIAASMTALLAALAQAAPVQTGWQLPPEAQGFEIARDIMAGGTPMRVSGFVSALPPQDLAERFAQRLGEPLVETRLPHGRGIVLGRLQQDGYLTVQIAAAGSGSRGIVALADVARTASGSGVAAAAGRWLERLPAGTRVLSDNSSRDGGRFWRQLVLSNAAAPDANRDALEQAMRDDGLRLQHARKAQDGEALLFAAPGREMIAAILHRDDGSSAIVLDAMWLDTAKRDRSRR